MSEAVTVYVGGIGIADGVSEVPLQPVLDLWTDLIRVGEPMPQLQPGHITAIARALKRAGLTQTKARK